MPVGCYVQVFDDLVVSDEARDGADAEAIQGRIRHRILLQFFAWRALLDKDERKERAQWECGGVFSMYATERIAANDLRRLERLLRSCARPG